VEHAAGGACACPTGETRETALLTFVGTDFWTLAWQHGAVESRICREVATRVQQTTLASAGRMGIFVAALT